jgi:hypothetical protein
MKKTFKTRTDAEFDAERKAELEALEAEFEANQKAFCVICRKFGCPDPETEPYCEVCGKFYPYRESWPWNSLCEPCAAGFPPAVVQASRAEIRISDLEEEWPGSPIPEGLYVARLRSGEVIRFRSAQLASREFICLCLTESNPDLPSDLKMFQPESLQVRASDIVWAIALAQPRVKPGEPRTKIIAM